MADRRQAEEDLATAANAIEIGNPDRQISDYSRKGIRFSATCGYM